MPILIALAGFCAPFLIYAPILALHVALPARTVDGYVLDRESGRPLRYRLNGLRVLLVSKLKERGAPGDFSFIANERGMFSFLGITKEQVVRLREEFHVYMLESSRINLAGINSTNVDYVADSIVAVL